MEPKEITNVEPIEGYDYAALERCWDNDLDSIYDSLLVLEPTTAAETARLRLLYPPIPARDDPATYEFVDKPA